MPEHLGEVEFTLQELQRAIGRLKVNKAPDTVGIAAELLKFIPDDFLQCLLDMYNFMLFNGSVPPVWKETVNGMLPKKMRAVQTSDFRPVANTRFFYKAFAYMLLGRIENTLDLHQPEVQHGFRPNRRLEEHLVFAAMFLDKGWASGKTIWVVSLDLSILLQISFTKSTCLGNKKKRFDIVNKKVHFQVPIFVGVGWVIL